LISAFFALALLGGEVAAQAELAPPLRERAVVADFKRQSASTDVRQVAHRVLDSRENRGLPFVILDKVEARVFVFDAIGRLQGTDFALLGMARGDHSPAGIGAQRMSSIAPADRTTPAGRFPASLTRDAQGKEVLMIDYAAAITLHAVVKGTPAERRAERLQSPTASDNRISYGCINVPKVFYKEVVSPVFAHGGGIVYVLPETRKADEVLWPSAGKRQ